MTNEIKKLQLKQAKTLLEVYKKYLEEIKKSILELAQSGGNTLKQNLEKKRIENLIQQLKKEFKTTTDKGIKESYQEGAKEQNRHYEALGVAIIGAMQTRTIENVYYTHLSRITGEMERKLKSFVRTDFENSGETIKGLNKLIPPQSGIKPLNNLASSGLLSSEIKPEQWKRLMSRLERDMRNKDIFTIPYYNKAGDVVRHVKASTYAEMLSRTLTANTYREAAQDSILNQFGEFGDLVEILGRSIYPDSPCIPYQGQILSLTGKTKGFTTIDEAKGNGLFHPNCIHSFAVTDRVIDEYLKLNEAAKGQKAIDYLLLKQEGEVKNAFHRNDIGNIDLIWGDDTKGLKHIITRRTQQNIDIKEFLSDLAEVIEEGQLVRINNRGRYEIFLNGKMAIIEPASINGKQTFLLTAFKRRKA